MKLIAIVIPCLTIIACNKDDAPSHKTDSFVLTYQHKGAYLYMNPECEFDNRSSQSQFTWTATSLSGVPEAYVFFSTYRNANSQDSTLDQAWIELYVEYDSAHSSFSVGYLEQLLLTENSNMNYCHLYPHVQVDVCGKRFDNEDIITEPGESVYEINENFTYTINDYEVLYTSKCLDRMLLFLNITLEGMLYKHDFGIKQDSIFLEEANLKLLFDID